ncbi:hypothetical protein F5883DRAFT_638437 [Diaporthe sp. PMI_573]|nr:hypothetical protein F5883DRAFT_638437 [Diaporthaceae sp. PMI_573]
MCLWERAADRLDQQDKETLEEIAKSNAKPPHGHGSDSPTHDVNSTLERARKLEDEGKKSSWSPAVHKIIEGALAFKSLGDAAVQFDKSGYASLGWSVVSFGLQVAANAGEASEFVLSSSEIITRFMAKYREYELFFRGPEAGDDFDEQLTNVYKAILLYMIALDKYLRQSGIARLAHATLKLEDRSINSKKKAIVDADAEISHWLLIISQKRSDNNFSQIRTLLQDLPLPKIPEPSQECARSLSFPGMDDRFNDIERATEGTCKWLLGHETYRDWAADDCAMLCIKGKPGSGKSTLLRYAVSDAVVASNIRDRSLSLHNEGLLRSGETAEAQAEPGALILSFFFHDRGTELQKTTLGLYRSLLHQLLRHAPDAISTDLLTTFKDRKDNMGESGEKWQWHWRELRDFFGSSLRKALERRPVCLLIDALDEYGKDNANQLIKNFKTWTQECQPRSQLHICFTCRHHPRLALPDGISEIRLESENENDISAYVRLQLSAWSSSEHVAAIQTDITSRASGVFIWARLIVERVLNLQREGENWRMIREEVEQSPIELNDLYRGLIEQVADKVNSSKLIQWISFAMEPLTLDELRWAVVVEPDLSYSPNSLRDYQSSKHFASDCDMMEKRLTTLSCGLAEVVPSFRKEINQDNRKVSVPSRVVQFIHQTVKDFFMAEGLATLQICQSLATIDTDGADLAATAHYQLSRMCIRYLSTDEIMQAALIGTASELMPEFPLLRYAVLNWVAHVQRSDEANTPNDLLSYFGWPSEAIVQRWADAFGSLRMYDRPFYARKGATLLHVASANRWMGPLLDIMERKEELKTGLDAMDSHGYTALCLAADGGHEDIVQLLLKNGANVDGGGEDGKIPLRHAAVQGNVDIVRTLLEKGANVNAVGKNRLFATALLAASGEGYEDIVRMLLENGADVDEACREHGAPLREAARNGHEQVVKMLLEHGADVNAWDQWYGCALTAAIKRGPERESMVRMLLENGADVKSHGAEVHGFEDALQMASDYGYEEIVETIREYGAA